MQLGCGTVWKVQAFKSGMRYLMKVPVPQLGITQREEREKQIWVTEVKSRAG